MTVYDCICVYVRLTVYACIYVCEFDCICVYICVRWFDCICVYMCVPGCRNLQEKRDRHKLLDKDDQSFMSIDLKEALRMGLKGAAKLHLCCERIGETVNIKICIQSFALKIGKFMT